jgi:hypothetical protein
LTSNSRYNSLITLPVCSVFRIFYTLLGRPLQAGLSVLGSLSIHAKNCAYFIPSGIVRGVLLGSSER